MAKIILAIGLFIGLAGTASAQSVIVTACKQAIQHLLVTDTVEVAVVQDFSNLTPPRAKLRLDDLLSSGYTCTFSSTKKPVGLVEFCSEDFCYEPGNSSFDEIAELLRRDGY